MPASTAALVPAASPALGSTPRQPGLDMRTDGDALLWLIDLVSAYGTTVADQRRQERYAVLPSGAHPRYLVPLGHGRATSINLRAGQSGWAAQALRAVAVPAARLGALHLLTRRVIHIPSGHPRHPTLAEHLAERTGHPRLVLSLSIGPPRPNRKPILQLTAPDGTLVAFAKVSTNAHTAALVANEAAVLERLGARTDLGVVTAPQLLDHFRWKGHDVILLRALPTPRQGRHLALPLTAEVVRTIAQVGARERVPAAESRWWATVEGRAAKAEPSSAAALRPAIDAWRTRWGAAVLEFGQWHGDLTPWNGAWHRGRFLVWDWERSGGPVPLGLDVIHNAFQPRLLVEGASVAEAIVHATRTQLGLLGQLDIDTTAAHGVGAAYLLELGLRLADDARFGSLGPHAGLPEQVLAAAQMEASHP